MLTKINRWLRGKWYDWKHQNAPRDVCCCGADMLDHDPYWDNHAPIEAYDYYRDLYVRGE